MKLNTEIVKRMAGRGGLYFKKHSPEILLVGGVVGIVASTVMACKATLKVEEVLDKAEHQLTVIGAGLSYVKDNGVDQHVYTEADARKDVILVYVQTASKLVKLYSPAVLLGGVSLAAILGSHKILRGRNVALAAAYTLVDQGFTEYRERVISELGEDKDNQFRYGITKEKIDDVYVDPETGKEKKAKKPVDVVNPNDISVYARFFDETSTEWQRTAEYNLMYLKAQQNYANDILHARGHLFLNEVYDMLGMERSSAGQVVGWVISKDGDNFVDFGIFDIHKQGSRDFVNGFEKSILLDFNVDGVIYDKI